LSNETIIQFFEQKPFSQFVMVTVDGREFLVKHPEQAMFGIRGETVLFFHPDHTLEVIESRLIVSLRTLRDAEFPTFGG
jgi:hypothetical protein